MMPFNFNNTYLNLPNCFYSVVKPQHFKQAELVLLNNTLATDLNINIEDKEAVLNQLLGLQSNTTSFAQAYAGHQFGNFTMLGDGRAIVLGEHLNQLNQRYDIQLKGSGRTPYSRGGDGNATLKAMLREYLMSEAMHYLNIPTSRSLAVIGTGETVYRESIHQGAAVARVMKSHIRVGTFEFASYFTNTTELNALLQYTTQRLFPELTNTKNLALSFINAVTDAQLQLITNWMRVGFIHGVMNTDNTAISGETFDYGPCAFINNYSPATVYSSIDSLGRYAFANQPNIIKWNLIKLAQALLPLIDDDQKKAISLVQELFENFNINWQNKYYAMMLGKIGLQENNSLNRQLVDELLIIMQQQKLDYTNTFSSLCYHHPSFELISSNIVIKDWTNKWTNSIKSQEIGEEGAKLLMQKQNPVFIPRNHLVEDALTDACLGNFSSFNKLLAVVSNPYVFNTNLSDYLNAPEEDFDANYKTFCGT